MINIYNKSYKHFVLFKKFLFLPKVVSVIKWTNLKLKNIK